MPDDFRHLQPPGKSWGWRKGIGEANRPLHEGGHYMHPYTKQIWANQYGARRYEIILHTANYGRTDGPQQHCIVMSERYEDKQAGDTWETEHIASRSVDVDDRNDPDAQDAAELEAFAIAHTLMEQH